MADVKCDKCGETLPEDALSCWACGTLTEAGLAARRGERDDDEAWRRSVEAARERHARAPAIDPDATLQRVLAETGQDLPTTRRRPEPVLELRRDTEHLLSSAETLGSLGGLLAFLTSLGGVLAAVVGILSGNTLQLLAGIAAFVAVGGLSLYMFFMCRFMAQMGHVTADGLHQLRRLQAAFQEHERAQGSEERP